MSLTSPRTGRLSALLCAVAVLVCELVAKPWAEMGIVDDWSYIRTAQLLAQTGHIHYNGYATAMIGWQLYLAAAADRLFGFSFTAARMTTLLVALVTTFLLHRTLVRCGIQLWNASLGTLTLALSPLFLLLSVTFMTDIAGLFAVVICLYSCLRALQASGDRAAILWICFAALANAIFGTSRQIAWLGVLVMVPSTLWLMRSRRRVLIFGVAACLLGDLLVLLSMRWFETQPYIVPETFALVSHAQLPVHIFVEFFRAFLDIPLLLLPIIVVFLPEIRRSNRITLAVLAICSAAYVVIGIKVWHGGRDYLLAPTIGDWVSAAAYYVPGRLIGEGPILLNVPLRILLTFAAVGGTFCLCASLFARRGADPDAPSRISRTELRFLLLPFAVAYCIFLIPRASSNLFDRYLLPLLVVALIAMLRFYQDFIHPRLPSASVLVLVPVVIYSISSVHNWFAFYRARIALTEELRNAGIPDLSVNHGWESDLWLELQHKDYLTFLLEPPAVDPPQVSSHPDPCPAEDPHRIPPYRFSFDPNGCQGLASFAPVHYVLWPTLQTAALYVVRVAPSSTP